MLYVLYALFFLSCIMLIASVLLQPGKTDAGALFTSNVSSTAFAPRGTASVLAKFTIGAAIVFMLSALIISMPALSGNVSVLSGNEEAPAESGAVPGATPAADATPETPIEQTVTINPEGNVMTLTPANTSNGNSAGNTAANSANTSNSNRVAVPVQPNPPSNQ